MKKKTKQICQHIYDRTRVSTLLHIALHLSSSHVLFFSHCSIISITLLCYMYLPVYSSNLHFTSNEILRHFNSRTHNSGYARTCITADSTYFWQSLPYQLFCSGKFTVILFTTQTLHSLSRASYRRCSAPQCLSANVPKPFIRNQQRRG